MFIIRGIAALIIGCVVIGLLFYGGTVGLAVGVGMDRLLSPGSYDATSALIACCLVLMAVPSIVGGFVCASIARTRIPVMLLAVLVLGFGITSGMASAGKPDPGVRSSSASMTEVMQKIRQPAWFGGTIGVVGALSVMLGGRLRK